MGHQSQLKVSLGLFRYIRPKQSQCKRYILARLNSTFDSMVHEHKTKAKNSVVVEISPKENNIKQSIAETLNICETFGVVDNAIRYPVVKGHTKELLFVEFQKTETVKSLLESCVFKSSEEFLPVQTRFLLHNGTVKTRLKSHNVNLEYNERCSLGNLNKKLGECKNTSEQMTFLHKTECLEDYDRRVRFISCVQIEDALSGMFPNCQALPFGSSVNGFGKYNCDLDMFLDLEGNQTKKKSVLHFQNKEFDIHGRIKLQQTLHVIGDLLHNFLPNISTVQKILNARVPILKFQQKLLGLDCDLSMSNKTGVYMSELLFMYGRIDERLQPLVFTVRKWAANCGITNPSPGPWISNFTLSLMVIFFLQDKKILPSLQKLKELNKSKDKRIVEGVDCTFIRDEKLVKSSADDSSLETLLVQFFEFYLKFDFKEFAISLVDGRPIIKPQNNSCYIENPLERSLNVSRNVSVNEILKLKQGIESALWRLENSSLTNTNWGILSLLHNQSIKAEKRKLNIHINEIFEKDGPHDQLEQNKPKTTVKPVYFSNAKRIEPISHQIQFRANNLFQQPKKLFKNGKKLSGNPQWNNW